MSKMFDPHEAQGTLVTTPIGNDGVRWACVVCNETVFERDGNWYHFYSKLDPR